MTRPAWWEQGPGPDDRRGPGASRGPGGHRAPDGGIGRRPDAGSGRPGPPPGRSPGPAGTPGPAAPRPAPTARYGPPGWNVPPDAPPAPPRGGPPPPAPPRRRPSRWRVPGAPAIVGALVLAGVVAVVLFPEALDLDQRSPFVQVVAFRPQLAAVVLLVAALAAFGAWRRAASGGLVVALAVGLVGGVGVADTASRGIGGADDVTATPGGVTVLVLNTYKGDADADDLAELVRTRDPDLISLPEARGDLRRRLESRLDEGQGGSGYRSYSADDADDASGMTVFVRSSLGRPTVVQDREGTYPAIVVDLPRSAPGVAAGLRFVADHPRSPKPGDTYGWVRDVGRLARWCDADRPTVIAGDMNATADHALFRSSTANCTDAGAATGDGVIGTWPSWAPAFLGAQIDHVLTAGGPEPVGFEVAAVGGTDHRAVLARIGPG